MARKSRMNSPVSRIRILVILLWATVFAWFFLRPDFVVDPEVIAAGPDPAGEDLYWFKGNTHTHAHMTVQDYSHGDSTADEVAAWYRRHGYHFVAITDHNRYTQGPKPADPGASDFLIIPGMEVTADHRYPGVNQEGERKIHLTALNIGGPVEWDFSNPEKSAIIEEQARRIRAHGGLPILNHPNYRFQVELVDILAADEVHLLEIFNAHPRSNHAGHPGFRPGVEELWDQVLDSGRLIYGVAADDAHDFKWYRQALRRLGYAPPGGAWIMVRATRLDAGSITSAMEAGNFYSSTGVHLSNVTIGKDIYEVTIDLDRTREEIRHGWVKAAAPVVWSDDSHYVIEFIGPHGQILHSTHDQEHAGIPLDGLRGYVRARVTWLEKAPRFPGEDRARAYYAWAQPVMLPLESAERAMQEGESEQ